MTVSNCLTARSKVLGNADVLDGIFKHLSPNELRFVATVSKIFKSSIPHNVRYPFVGVQDIDGAKYRLRMLEGNPLVFLREKDPHTNRTAAVHAFREGRFDVAEFFIGQGGTFQAEEVIHVTGSGLYFEYPSISQAISEARYKIAKDKGSVLQEILVESCNKGNLKRLEWVMAKQQESRSPLSLFEPLEEAIKGGFFPVVEALVRVIDPSQLKEEKKYALVNLSLEMGYPDIALFLGKCQFPLSSGQKREIQELQALYAREERKGERSPVSAPASINQRHSEIHGGDLNREIYEREFQQAVAYALRYMRNPECHFRTLIENLGHRRRRMAVLGNLRPLDHFGLPQTITMRRMTTSFNQSSYMAYGDRIRKLYGERFPIQVFTYIRGERIPLTEITRHAWFHPIARHREIVLDEVHRLCKEICSTEYPEGAEDSLAFRIGNIYWLLSHAAPFVRGTPTIVAMLSDALWLYHGRTPLSKMPDLNCEALVYDQAEAFAQYLASREDLPKLNLSLLKKEKSSSSKCFC